MNAQRQLGRHGLTWRRTARLLAWWVLMVAGFVGVVMAGVVAVALLMHGMPS